MTKALELKLPGSVYSIIMIGLTLAAFPGACFSSFIAANSFKTVMPKVSPYLSVSIGTVVSIILAVTGVAGKLPLVFGIIGASFGPICGAMAADYLLTGSRWWGPRAGFNPAGWIAWALGFLVGVIPALHEAVPTPSPPSPPPRSSPYVVGAVVYATSVSSSGCQDHRCSHRRPCRGGDRGSSGIRRAWAVNSVPPAGSLTARLGSRSARGPGAGDDDRGRRGRAGSWSACRRGP